MSLKTLVLASASPARRLILQNAGIQPVIAVSEVDEATLLSHAQQNAQAKGKELSVDAQVQLLATAKAQDVAKKWRQTKENTVVLGCDSMLYMHGEITGKPHNAATARARLQKMRGNWGELYTGHCVIDLETGIPAQAVSKTKVYIGEMTDAEIDAYIATEEPLHVAGSFTIDGLGGPFIEKVEGCHHGVIGLSLPVLRKLLQEIGHTIPDFWQSYK